MLRSFAIALVCLLTTIIVAADTNAESPAIRAVSPFTLKDYRGHEVSLEDFTSSRLTVVAFLGTECPLAKLYAGRLQEISDQYNKEDLAVIGVISNVQDSVTKIDAFVRRHKISFPVLKDVGNVVADDFQATRTPEVFLIDQNRTIRYQGRIDDQYLVGVIQNEPKREDLKTAINEVLASQSVSVPALEAIGCLIGRVRTPDENSAVTYSNQISRLFQSHCIECHREGQIAPFALTSYEDAAGWGEMIAEVVNQNRMPPWHADPSIGEFVNDCSLSDDEKELVNVWVRNGCPEGDPSQLPEPVEFASEWQLSRMPDRIIAMAETPFLVPADAGEAGVEYQNLWVDGGFETDLWVNGMEVRPGNPQVVHHIIVYLHPEGKDSKEHSFLTAYVPGLRLRNGVPDGAAKRIPAGSWLRFQIHYTPIGSEQSDLSILGILAADPANITHEVRTEEVPQPGVELEPHLADQKFRGRSAPAEAASQLLSMSPHMHLRGKSFRYEVEYPDGTTQALLDVPRFDFNWQTRYVLAEPISLPAGARILCHAVFDNSEDNLANPDPSKRVAWGEQSWDEMMIGYFDVLIPRNAESEEIGRIFGRGPKRGDFNIPEIVSFLDANDDGRLSRHEARVIAVIRKSFDLIDGDSDGHLTEDELRVAMERAGLGK